MRTDAREYDSLTREITSAGFFVAPPHGDDPFARICAATKFQPGVGYSGNSFWIAKLDDKWFVGVWGGMLYLSEAPEKLGQLTIDWFTHKPNGTAPDFDAWILEKYQLVPFDHEEFDNLIND